MSDSQSAGGLATQSPGELKKTDMSRVMEIPVTVQVELASKTISISELLELEVGSLIPFEKAANEALDIRVNGHLIGRGEPVVVNERYAVRLIEVSALNAVPKIDVHQSEENHD